MEVTATYQLPFDSEYDWRTTLFEQYNFYTMEAAKQVISKLDKDKFDFEWQQRQTIMQFAIDNGLIDIINALALQKIKEYIQ
jgi:outer membrane biogenesis lipoprotein LolB